MAAATYNLKVTISQKSISKIKIRKDKSKTTQLSYMKTPFLSALAYSTESRHVDLGYCVLRSINTDAIRFKKAPYYRPMVLRS